VANRTDPDTVAAICALRRLRFSGPELAELLELPVSTVSAVLKRCGMGKLGRLGLEPAERYERQRPGSAISAPGRAGPRPTGKPNASSAPCSPAGPTARSTPQADNAPPPLTAGCGTTTIAADTKPSGDKHPSPD
jgi:hypothetical protein